MKPRDKLLTVVAMLRLVNTIEFDETEQSADETDAPLSVT